jgi:hypothetical protein
MNMTEKNAAASNMTANNSAQFALIGAAAGSISALAFTIIHDIFISDIWFSLALMLVAGALCGACLSWSYALLVDEPNLKNWLGYNLIYDGMFVLLGLVSVLIFQPEVSMASLISANGPPEALISQAMPVTAIFTLLLAVVISLIYRTSWSRFGAVLLTCTVLVLLLGLNVSVIGLVSIPRGSWYLVLEMFALILTLNAVFVLAFVALERSIANLPFGSEQKGETSI